ncbi:MAG: histidine--tRNA ligase [Chitinophagaceae bacterium]
MKPSIPQGTRDFGPETVRKRQYIFQTIRSVFEQYGFQPLETPSMENLDTLMGKYGEEGDKLIFKILNNGLDNPAKTAQTQEGFAKILEGKSTKVITERALRYDLTIPFARFVAMNHTQLVMPFKRYQIQPVWRADRPQKGRYREFYQCDADVVGSRSLLNEVELTMIYVTVFQHLGIPVDIRINNRKILAALAAACGGSAQLTDITVAIDKLDKIGLEKVQEELLSRGLAQQQVDTISAYLAIGGTNAEKISALKALLGNEALALEGISELEYILSNTSPLLAEEDKAGVTIDFTLARGLNYYTGTIYEVKATGVQMGSIGGGGRYDDLTGLFGVPNIPGVGISFGVDRIYDVMEELAAFPDSVLVSTEVLFFNLGTAETTAALQLSHQLRQSGMRCEVYHEQAKFNKQFGYAEKKQIPYVAILGEKELEEKTINIKNMLTGEQQTVSWSALQEYFKK